jgi:hydrogenase/urease accessory protein HupE
MKSRAIAALVIACAALTGPAAAHEVRPAYLELRETPTGELDVLWKTPMQGDLRLALAPVLSGASEELTPIATRRAGGAAVQTWRLRLREPLRGRTLQIDGLRGTMTDALVRIEFADGGSWLARLTPQAPEVTIPVVPGGSEVAWSYFGLGVEHILLGIDHLLFVLALLLITRGTRRLALTITAFTVAHSITLALATLGFVRVPSAPVEAVIALSIVFVAAEIVRARRGDEGLTAHAPWIVAFTFGLLHGFGFAGALAEIGLPPGQIPLALLFFNVGVEGGQLLFVVAVLAFAWPLRRARIALPGWAGLVPPYAIGSVAMFWVIERIAAF